VSGSTIPIFTGVSARARIGNGAAIAEALHARPALSKVRRGKDRAPAGVILPIVGSACMRLDSPFDFMKGPAKEAECSSAVFLAFQFRRRAARYGRLSNTKLSCLFSRASMLHCKADHSRSCERVEL
jgi:hypothetical protein